MRKSTNYASSKFNLLLRYFNFDRSFNYVSDVVWTYFTPCSGASIVNFEHINADWEYLFFFSISVFFHGHSRITGQQGKGKGISLTPHYHFHLFHRYLDISWAITAESSHLNIGSGQTWSRTFGFWAQVAKH